MDKITIKGFIGHFKTITKHKLTVQTLCFKCGLFKQGLLHDLSKYTPTEFIPGAKYYQGFRSPIDKERELYGYSKAWLHHKGRNKHHWEYWIQRNPKNPELEMLEMPFNYVIESTLDKIGASKVYNKQNYKDDYPYNFYMKGKDKMIMHPHNVEQTDKLLKYLADNGEEKALRYYKELYHKWKKDHSFKI